jgi:hypothetical protein
VFQILVSIACVVFLWQVFKQWRENRWVRKVLEPGAGLTVGVERDWPRWLLFSCAAFIPLVVLPLLILFTQSHEGKERNAQAVETHDKCVDAHMDASIEDDAKRYLAALEKC